MAGLLQDGDGNVSSKRAESFIALGAALLIAGVATVMHDTSMAPSALVGGFLAYSAAMQGISMSSERNMVK